MAFSLLELIGALIAGALGIVMMLNGGIGKDPGKAVLWVLGLIFVLVALVLVVLSTGLVSL